MIAIFDFLYQLSPNVRSELLVKVALYKVEHAEYREIFIYGFGLNFLMFAMYTTSAMQSDVVNGSSKGVLGTPMLVL